MPKKKKKTQRGNILSGFAAARALAWITCVLRRLHGQVQVGLASKTEGAHSAVSAPFDLPPAKEEKKKPRAGAAVHCSALLPPGMRWMWRRWKRSAPQSVSERK